MCVVKRALWEKNRAIGMDRTVCSQIIKKRNEAESLDVRNELCCGPSKAQLGPGEVVGA